MQRLPETLFCIGCGTLTAILISGWIVIPLVVHNRLETEMSISNGSRRWDGWIAGKPQMQLKVYVFNVTNPEVIEAGGEPIVEEIGPYVYIEQRVKREIQQDSENDTVSFAETITYHFSEELSAGSEVDEIVALNVPFVFVAQQVATLSTIQKFLASTYIMKFKAKVFVRCTIEELLFKGTYQPMIYELEKLTGQQMLPNSTFGLFYGKNATQNEEMEIHSGLKDFSRVGETISWNGKTKLDFWNGTYCNMINGTDGTLFPPFVTKDRIVYLFMENLCRTIRLTYKGEVNIDGIPALRFAQASDFIDDPRQNADQRCYCTEKNIEQCPRSGVYQLKSCRNGAPLLISTAHFLDGDDEYIGKFGLIPKRELHETVLEIEPSTGTTLRLHKRFQLNADTSRLSTIAKFKDIKDMVFPLIWFDESTIIDEESTAELRSSYITPLKAVHITIWFLFGCSVLLIAAAIGIFVARSRKKPVFV